MGCVSGKVVKLVEECSVINKASHFEIFGCFWNPAQGISKVASQQKRNTTGWLVSDLSCQ